MPAHFRSDTPRSYSCDRCGDVASDAYGNTHWFEDQGAAITWAREHGWRISLENSEPGAQGPRSGVSKETLCLRHSYEGVLTLYCDSAYSPQWERPGVPQGEGIQVLRFPSGDSYLSAQMTNRRLTTELAKRLVASLALTYTYDPTVRPEVNAHRHYPENVWCPSHGLGACSYAQDPEAEHGECVDNPPPF